MTIWAVAAIRVLADSTFAMPAEFNHALWITGGLLGYDRIREAGKR